jgi:hypothetical protein
MLVLEYVELDWGVCTAYCTYLSANVPLIFGLQALQSQSHRQKIKF